MSVATVITEGFGSFGDIAHIVRDGYDGNMTPPPVITRDTHDGFDEDSHRRAKEEQAAKDEAFRSARDRLREVIARAYDPEHGKEEVQAIAAPYVERMESGATRIDYEALERNKRVMDEILAYQQELRREFDARMARYAEDEEDVTLLLMH